MNDLSVGIDPGLDTLEGDSWHERLDEICEEHGHVDSLTDNITAYFIDAGKTLLVSFETLGNIKRLNSQNEPRGLSFAKHHGWSSLNIVADDDTWFREQRMYRYFDRLTDDEFFDDFDTVIFYGVGSCGYAACAFSVAAPNAKVLAIRPQATLSADLAGWDRRFITNRKDDFNGRYGYAPKMLEAANAAFIVYDPLHTQDSGHASLFRRSNVALLPIRGAGERVENMLSHYKIVETMLIEIADNSFNPNRFSDLIRAERGGAWHLQRVVALARFYGHNQIAANVCACAVENNFGQYFKRTLARLASNGFTPTSTDTKIQTPQEAA